MGKCDKCGTDGTYARCVLFSTEMFLCRNCLRLYNDDVMKLIDKYHEDFEKRVARGEKE